MEVLSWRILRFIFESSDYFPIAKSKKSSNVSNFEKSIYNEKSSNFKNDDLKPALKGTIEKKASLE